MQTFKTHGVLSASTGVLMGDIGALYEVASYLLGRSAFTHELAHYGEAMAKALIICHPELPDGVDGRGWEAVRNQHIQKWGGTMNLDTALAGVLADDKNPIETLKEMGFTGDVVAIKT